MIGDALGNYRLVAELGSGSMGVVFLAEHQRIARRAAIKVLAPELVRDQQALQRFFNEARATSLIRHPGIVDVYDCDVDATGRAYIVMEHLEGETLAERLRRAGKLHWSAACLIARRVADALGAVHDKGIVHCDLKPENLFLVGNGRDPAAAVKVLDFGVAQLLTADVIVRSTMRGVLLGTPEYMSPEQCAGAEAVDHRADIYALGCILFEMLTADPPFVTSSVGELVVSHRFRQPPSATASCSDLPEWLGHLLVRMLAKEPDRRPRSMQEVSRALYAQRRYANTTGGILVTEAAAPRTTVELSPPRAATKVLLVDDDFAILDGISDFLESEGFAVVSASNGIDALNQLRAALRVDVIVLDVMMPIMDGWDFRSEQLADPSLRDIPVVVISACGFAQEQLHQQFKAYEVLPKPLDLGGFLRALKDACGGNAPGSTSSSTAGQ